MIKSNCHTHTTFCDGKNSAEEMTLAAIEKGFVTLGFSGHSPMYYEADWTMPKEKVSEYIKDIRRVKEKYADIILKTVFDHELGHAFFDMRYNKYIPEEFLLYK